MVVRKGGSGGGGSSRGGGGGGGSYGGGYARSRKRGSGEEEASSGGTGRRSRCLAYIEQARGQMVTKNYKAAHDYAVSASGNAPTGKWSGARRLPRLVRQT